MNNPYGKDEFRDRLREIAHFALRHANDLAPGPLQRPDQVTFQAFFRKVWEGWKQAQVCIVAELVQISEQRTALEELQKDARKNRNHNAAKPIGRAIRVLDHAEAILRTVSNSMVWTMYGTRRWIVRRLWAGGSLVPITSISPDTFHFVDDVNRSPDSVALMADITSLVNIGDVVVAHLDPEHRGPYVVELKGGPINDRIVAMVDEFGPEMSEVPAEELDVIDREIGPRGRKHLERVARQEKRTRNFLSIANDDVGEDPETGQPMRNIGPVLGVDTYDASLMDMMLAAGETGSAVDCIDGCLWVGVYYSTQTPRELRKRFRQEFECRGASTSFRVWNLLSVSTDARLQPIFLRELALESILDIMLGDVQIFIYMDWAAFFQKASEAGITARWTTKQERKEITETYYQERAFRSDAHIPVMEKDGVKVMLTGGMVARTVNEGLSPLSLLDMIQMSLDRGEKPDDGVDAAAVL